jgi:hypothetical protein
MTLSGYVAPLGLTSAVPGQLVAIGNDGTPVGCQGDASPQQRLFLSS